jgi:alpha-tubulin suppressor-like RCC1 family protein
MRRIRSTILPLLGLLAACGDRTPVTPAPRAAQPASTQRFDCIAYPREQRVTCGEARASGARGSLIGGQGQYTRVTSSNVVADSVAGTLQFDVTVQNLLPYALGTRDGVTPDSEGVTVFFNAGPTVTSGWGNVTVTNPDGIGVFTASGQPYFRYPGILAPGQTSAARTWLFHLDPDVEFFGFTVLISTRAAPLVVIDEIMAHPSTASEAAGEWFEVHNRTGDPVDLNGWTIASGGDAGHTITGSLVVPGHGYVVLGGSTDPAANGGAGVQYAYTGIALGNDTTDWLALRSPVGTADSVSWGAASGTAAAPPVGRSLALPGPDVDNTHLGGAGSPWVASETPFGGGGELGSPGSRTRLPMDAVSVAPGQVHTCAIDPAGQAWCWGRDLGRSSTDPTPHLAGQPAGVSFTSVVSGQANSCALATTGQAYCWGRLTPTSSGLFTRSAPSPVPQPSGVTFTSLAGMNANVNGDLSACGLDAAGQAWCWGESAFTATAVPQPAGVQFSQLAMGGDRTLCALSTTGQAYCRSPGLGLASSDTFAAVPQGFGVSFQQIDATDRMACGISTIGQMFCWSPSSGTAATIVPHPPTIRFTMVSVGGSSVTSTVCGVATSGQVYCFGDNTDGKLGDGTTTPRADLTPVAQPSGVLFAAVEVSQNDACALRQGSGQVYCWGNNGSGQVGDGTTTGPRLTPVAVFR